MSSHGSWWNGAAAIAWTIVVWQWQDPFTGLYTRWQQHHLRAQYAALAREWRPPPPPSPRTPDLRATTARDAAAYRRATHAGEAIGTIVVGLTHRYIVDARLVRVNLPDGRRLPGVDLRIG